MDKINLDFKKFSQLAKKHTTIPVYKSFLADLISPVAAWARLNQKSDYGFMFESVEKGNQYSRYSYLGINTSKILKSENNTISIIEDDVEKKVDTNFFDLMKKEQKKHSSKSIEGMPPFTGGFVGFLGYETISWFENVPTNINYPVDIPDSIFMLFKEIIAFDHLKGSALVISNVSIEPSKKRLSSLYKESIKKIDEIGQLLHSDIDYQTPKVTSRSKVKSNFKKSDFKNAVLKTKDYITKGDIFQLVLSQRFERKTKIKPTTLYRSLRTINPSPYMFHLKLKDFNIIGASPEILVKVEDKTVEIMPIAGTRPRGKTKQEDEKFSKDLFADEKERAEHLMLVDLGRNDVGRVSTTGSIKIKNMMNIEKFSHVMHMVSNIRGKLLPNKNSFDALIGGFPAGTVSGAPKIRAMEIINELENDKRGIYSGAVGYYDFCGNLNTCIAIRTFVMKDDKVFFQAGAGIVHDSDPEKEFNETIHKAKALMKALDLAEDGLIQ